jgi:hypothetical protein
MFSNNMMLAQLLQDMQVRGGLPVGFWTAAYRRSTFKMWCRNSCGCAWVGLRLVRRDPCVLPQTLAI